jgi:hypothetical protein
METISSETPVVKEPHGVTSQKTAFITVTAVKASDLIQHTYIDLSKTWVANGWRLYGSPPLIALTGCGKP